MDLCSELLRAAEIGTDVEVVAKLIEQGADVNTTNGDLATPLIMAQIGGRTEVVALLIQKGAEINAFDRDGFTALHTACHWLRLGAVRALIQAGAQVNEQDNFGFTPLMTACCTDDGSTDDRAQIVVQLLGAGADTWVCTEEGTNALSMAKELDDPAIQEFIAKHRKTHPKKSQRKPKTEPEDVCASSPGSAVSTKEMDLATLQERLARIMAGKRKMTKRQVVELLGVPRIERDYGSTVHMCYESRFINCEFEVAIDKRRQTVVDDFMINPILKLSPTTKG